jgi:hypothetical protein
MKATIKKVNKADYEIYSYKGGYHGICLIGFHGANPVFGGDSANEDDYNIEYISDIYNQWDGMLVDGVVSISNISDDNKKIKSLFLTYFDGCYGHDANPNLPTTFAMGVCKLEYIDNTLTVHLRRPGLLIGRGGRTIDTLAKYLDCKINIVEVNLLD